MEFSRTGLRWMMKMLPKDGSPDAATRPPESIPPMSDLGLAALAPMEDLPPEERFLRPMVFGFRMGQA